MSKNLVIVESPAKAKTLEKFLGKDYKVTSSYGHIADLPSSEIGINLETFDPEYIVNDDKKKVVSELKKMSKNSDIIWLASDEDREGEAIAWHLHQQLGLEKKDTKRIVFNSITKNAVLKAIENPREINVNLVDAQQARRVLDRLVGYELSPVLWKKVKGGLSAGRVQSVAVRLIVEKEREVEDFLRTSSYKVSGNFMTAEQKKFKATIREGFEKEALLTFLEQSKNANYKVSKLEVKPSKRVPAAPFTTSTLQQEASRKLGFTVSRTMTVAQRLYEAGHITYMRTDSNTLSTDALNAAAEAVQSLYGDKYSKTRQYQSKSKGAQEAHEAIRPTNLSSNTLALERDQVRLYELIWKRTIASQMSEAQLEITNVSIAADTHDKIFHAKGEVIKFDGFLKVYLESNDDESDDEDNVLLPPLKQEQELRNEYIQGIERYTRPSARYTEASLVKQLEKLGIGRPSTYAPTISTIQNRGYVEKGTDLGKETECTKYMLKEQEIKDTKFTEMLGSNKGKMVPTPIGKIVNDFLVEHFAKVLDYNFTAKVEESFDEIASGEENWKNTISSFYKDFHPKVKYVEEYAERQSGERELGVDPQTNKRVAVRLAKFGPVVQIGNSDDDDIRYAGLLPHQTIDKITLEEALMLFQLPRNLGEFDDLPVEVNTGRYGPYVKYDSKFISLPKGTDVFSTNLSEAIECIKEKQKADEPIAHYQDKPLQKGVGRFGPFIKWDGMFINVSKKYDFDHLTQQEIEELIELKLKKEREKVVKNWEEEGIRIEKGRWRRHIIIKGKTKVELAKEIDVSDMTLEEAKKYIQAKSKKII